MLEIDGRHDPGRGVRRHAGPGHRADDHVSFTDAIKKVPLSPDIVGRIFNGSFEPKDGMPHVHSRRSGSRSPARPINPAARARPEDFIETGFLDHRWPEHAGARAETADLFLRRAAFQGGGRRSILRNSRLAEAAKKFIVVFAALGLTFHEYSFYMKVLEEMKTGFVAFVNMADEPVMERLLAPGSP